jgi:hypothetical protein
VALLATSFSQVDATSFRVLRLRGEGEAYVYASGICFLKTNSAVDEPSSFMGMLPKTRCTV